VLLTNHPSFGSTTISSIYKDRWEIELFFKTLKQNLKMKMFIGTSENALRIQICTAMIALLVLKWLHYLSKSGRSFSNLASMSKIAIQNLGNTGSNFLARAILNRANWYYILSWRVNEIVLSLFYCTILIFIVKIYLRSLLFYFL